MEFLSNMPIFFWVILVFVIIGGVYQLVSGKATQRDMEQAEALAEAGRWESAAGIYRKVIIERFDFPDRATAASDSLKALYLKHNVDADVSALDESMAVLRDIENAKVSDIKKTRMRGELLQKTVPVLNALPPVVDTAAVAAEFTPSSPPEAIDTTCKFSGQPVSGMAWTLDDYAENPNLDPNDLVGYVCTNCGAASHKDSDNGIIFKTWSGYDKSVCKACSQPLKEPKVILPA